MKKSSFAKTALTMGVAASTLLPSLLQAQQSEALLETLVRKGILTEQEAEDLKTDIARENRQYVKVRSAGKETVALDIYGDVRARYEGFYSDDPAMVDRSRYRYRLRLGMTATLFDRFEAGLRLSSSEASSSFGGDSISGNTTFQDNGSKKFLYIDLAYGRFYAFSNQTFQTTLTVGKMENPFVYSDMVFDGDYTPEGLGLNMAWNLNEEHSLKFNAGVFALDEISGQSEDPWMGGAQVRWDGIWKYDEAHKPKIQSSVGLGALAITYGQSLTNGAVPNANRGNTRLAGSGALAHHYNPIVADAAFTYTFDKFPMYAGTFPVRVGADFIYNPAAPDRNRGMSAGVSFGKSGKRGTWDVGYRYKYLGGDAWYEELTDSDFGGFYQGTAPTGGGTGYGAGTNVKGHILKASYSPYNSVTLTATWFKTKLIHEQANGSDSDMNRLQVDAAWKF